MDCQKKSEHMMDRVGDLALGEIHPKAELELLAHAAECEACREAYSEAKAVRALVDGGVAGLVEGEPSRQFNARLRASIARAAAPGGWNSGSFLEPLTRWPVAYVAGLAVLVAAIIFAAIGLPQRHRAVPLVAVAPAVTPMTSNSDSSFQPGAVGLKRPHAKPESGAIRSARVHREPEVLVPKGELSAVAQFYEATQSGRVDSEQIYAAQQQVREPLEVKPIEIAPLEPIAAASSADSASGPGLL